MFKFPLDLSDLVGSELSPTEQRLFSSQLLILSRIDPEHAQYYVQLHSSVEARGQVSLFEGENLLPPEVSEHASNGSRQDSPVRPHLETPMWAKGLHLDKILIRSDGHTVFVVENMERKLTDAVAGKRSVTAT